MASWYIAIVTFINRPPDIHKFDGKVYNSEKVIRHIEGVYKDVDMKNVHIYAVCSLRVTELYIKSSPVNNRRPVFTE